MKTKTRAGSAERKQLMQLGLITPAATPVQGALDPLRERGAKACSKLDAIMARRREMGRA